MNGAAPIRRTVGKHMVVKHSVRIAGHPTSVSLEPAFWEALCEIAARRGMPVNDLLAAIDAERSGNLSSAIRLFVLETCRRGELVSSDSDFDPLGYGGEPEAHRGSR